MNKGSILILGGKSDIGIAIAHKFAFEGYNIQLAARNARMLKNDLKDLQIRYNIKVTIHEFDVLKINSHNKFVSNLPELPMIIVCAVGFMGCQKENEKNEKNASIVFRSNFEGPANIFSIFANEFVKRGSGTLIGISSVAGDRGKASNYIYGSAKAGYTAFLSGMRSRLNTNNVKVITVLPGFVYSKMTKNMKLPKRLTTTPEEVAKSIFLSFKTGKDVIYVLPIWRVIMLIINVIPEKIFKRLSL